MLHWPRATEKRVATTATNTPARMATVESGTGLYTKVIAMSAIIIVGCWVNCSGRGVWECAQGSVVRGYVSEVT